ncbi:hypothetical protein P152DRAFT_450563 [Eremomyces bilateralis CBS 781.70]|uniref:Uncharacterized protein n=1 Tax=Eremomyces bilateralis CBS 781.70 TaxID=1392243 RepID=A0A6G1FZ67_9PEZI|nr:uncharacterized protein P152DRAFT_450563 [Eremomyces bilateralis CBS 781.70]KAF1810970.1 hypothetical protein P152DRAFT_450563 [Eremomyces bilateralis CBS 781.70]
MLSLPLVIPRDDHVHWYTPRHIQTTAPTGPTTTNPPPTQLSQTDPHTRPTSPRPLAPRSALALLAQDEHTIVQRKLNIRRFGAGWIRPPGIAKTYQATMDEEAERAEQEMLARREEQMAELAAAQDGEGMLGRGEMMEGVEGEEGGENVEGERDLDDEVPEAEEALYDDSEMGGEEYDEEITEGMLGAEEAELVGIAQEERDLDEDIPEAGSYQHTDTEEESSDGEEDVNEGRLLGIGNRMSVGTAGFEEGRSSLLSVSDLLDSSPVAGRSMGTRHSFMNRLRGQGNQRSPH